MAQKSRLNRNLEKKTKKRLILSILGIVVVIFLLFKFGIPALINFSLFLTQGKDQELAKQAQQNNQKILFPPSLNQAFSATNSANINITGSAYPQQEIELFVNDNLFGTTISKSDGSFSFEKVAITPGGNTIEAKVKSNNQESNFSNSLSITYDNTSPALTIDSPTDGQTFSGGNQQDIVVKGKTDNGNIKVTVDGFWAIMQDNGEYSYNLHLQNGSNQIKVVAQDQAGNQTEKDINVNFNQ